MTQTVEEFLDHAGVKGMKWGVRRAQKKSEKADKKWQKNIYSMRGAIDVHNTVADRMNGGALDALNKKHPDAHLDFPDKPATKRYLNEYEGMVNRFTKEAVSSVHGVSPSGNLKAKMDFSDPNQPKIVVEAVDAKHADDVLPKLIFELEIGEDGHIVSMRNVNGVLAQSIEEFIEHVGVKGMKWGTRKARGDRSEFKKPRKVSSDFKKTAPLRNKKVSELSNKQLKDVNERLNLEQNYSRMNPSTFKRGEKAVAAALVTAGLGVTAYNTIKSPAGQALIKAGKTAIMRGK